MKRLFFSIAFLLLIVGSGIAQDVRYNFDKNADFSKFKTYKWVAVKDATKVDDLVDKQIKETIDAELATKGLTKVDGDNADLYVAYQTAIGQEKQFTSYNTDWGYGGGWYGGGWYGSPGGGMTTLGKPRPSTTDSWPWICTTRRSTILSGEAWGSNS